MRRLIALLLFVLPGAAHARWIDLGFPRPDVSLRAVAAGPDGSVHVSGSKGTYGVGGERRPWRFTAPPASEALDFRGLAVTGRGRVVLMSAGEASEGRARLFRTIDDGATWDLAFETRQPGAFFDAIAFRDPLNGLVLGDPLDGGYYLLRTRDGGATWTRIAARFPTLQDKEAAFAASNGALLLGGGPRAWILTGGAARARVFSTHDFGDSWQAADAPIGAGPSGGLFGGHRLDRRLGVVVGGDHQNETGDGVKFALTRDGGRSWTAASHAGPAGLMESVGRLSGRTLLAVGPRGTSMSDDGGATWKKVDDVAHHAVACARGVCYAAGGRGRVSVWR